MRNEDDCLKSSRLTWEFQKRGRCGNKLKSGQLETILERIHAMFGKYKYAIIILVVGIFLLVFPVQKNNEAVPEANVLQDEIPLEIQLQTILEQIEGAGSVRVLLTKETGYAYTYQENVQSSTQTDQTQVEKETVLVSDKNGDEVPIVIKVDQPVYKGALIVCEGADRAAVKLAIIRAVSGLTGLRSDNISVIKMKGN